MQHGKPGAAELPITQVRAAGQAVRLAVAVAIMMRRTVWGAEIRAVGENAPAARYAGKRIARYAEVLSVGRAKLIGK